MTRTKLVLDAYGEGEPFGSIRELYGLGVSEVLSTVASASNGARLARKRETAITRRKAANVAERRPLVHALLAAGFTPAQISRGFCYSLGAIRNDARSREL